MKVEDRNRIADIYAHRLYQKKSPHEVVGWGSKESQDLRFQILSEIGITANNSILDVGSGLADMYFYLKGTGIRPKHYLGVDISNPLVEESRLRLAREDNAEVQCVDIVYESFEKKFDFVFCSGALNLKISDNWIHTEQMLTKMFELSSVGVACNFLSSYVDFSHEKDFHHSPEQVFSFAKKLTKSVTLRHDYPLYEFTIYLFKE